MDANMFAKLIESVAQMDEIVQGERRPSREFRIDAVGVKEIRQSDRAVSSQVRHRHRRAGRHAP